MPTCMPWKYPQQMRGQVPLFHNFHSRTGFTGLFSVRSLSTSHHTYQLLFFSSHFDQMPAEVAQLSALQSGIRGHQPSEVWGGGIGIGIGNSDMTIAISDCRNKCRWRGFPMPRPPSDWPKSVDNAISQWTSDSCFWPKAAVPWPPRMVLLIFQPVLINGQAVRARAGGDFFIWQLCCLDLATDFAPRTFFMHRNTETPTLGLWFHVSGLVTGMRRH